LLIFTRMDIPATKYFGHQDALLFHRPYLVQVPHIHGWPIVVTTLDKDVGTIKPLAPLAAKDLPLAIDVGVEEVPGDQPATATAVDRLLVVPSGIGFDPFGHCRPPRPSCRTLVTSRTDPPGSIFAHCRFRRHKPLTQIIRDEFVRALERVAVASTSSRVEHDLVTLSHNHPCEF